MASLLEDIARRVNWYTDPSRLESPEVAGVEISGVFRIGDSATFVQALGELINARVVDEGDELLLRAAAIP